MAISIYRYKATLSEVDTEWDSDIYFDKNTVIPNCPEAAEILSNIEHAEYVSPNTFRSLNFPESGEIDKKHLSSSTKLLLNVIAHPDICFSVGLADKKLLSCLFKLRSGKIMQVYRQEGLRADTPCDVLVNGKYQCRTMGLVYKKLREMPYELPEDVWIY